jgi:UDP-glucose 4-epimerase
VVMAAGRRVLVTGMGSDLGSRVTVRLEQEPWVGELFGLDVDPPRRRLHRATFELVPTTDHERIVDSITQFNPHVVVHIAVWEPYSRATPDTARRLTDDAATSMLGAAAECPALESVIVRSGTEIYGRAHGAPTRPDEDAELDPTCDYGRMLLGIERTAAALGQRIGVEVGAIRMGTVLGPHVPSPLGRVLRMPAVPFSVLADPPFAVVEDVEVAKAFVAAAERRLDQPVNVVANGAITSLQAAQRGRRIPIPLVGPDWALAKLISGLLGAPIPDHVIEAMHRGRLADNSRMVDLLGFRAAATTSDVVGKLYEWPTVVRVPARRAVA